MKPLSVAYVVVAAGLLAACGNTTEDRAEGGAAVGAGTGAAIGAVAGGVGAIPGALVGGAVGAGTGAATKPEQVNLGQPVWEDHDKTKLARAPMAGDDVRTAQQALRAQGYYRGPVDGIAGPQTRTALAHYQQRNGLRQTAMLDADTMQRLTGQPTTSYGSSGMADQRTGVGTSNPPRD
jgi:peptidoglycan hydrolase-like protein with peptidoglycan-binding domain/predicted small secreted protein